jgi:molybdenum cofactor cytidylyltransferase
VLFPRAVYPELRTAALDQGARAVVWRDPARVRELPVDELGPFLDIDTPAHYHALGLALAEGMLPLG